MENELFAHELPEKEINLGESGKLSNWLTIKETIENRIIGVFGGSGSGKTTLVNSLLYELKIPTVVLLTNDPNPNADLGRHLHPALIRNFMTEGADFLSKIVNVQRIRQEFFKKILASKLFAELFTLSMEADPSIGKKITKIQKDTKREYIEKTIDIESKLLKFQIEEQLKNKLEKKMRQLKIESVLTFSKKNQELLDNPAITSSMRAFLIGTFPNPSMALVLDDFGAGLRNLPEMNMLVTISRKSDLTIIIIAQSPRDVHPSIRDNMTCIIPTTQNAANWCMTHILRWGNDFKKSRQSITDLFDNFPFHAPLIHIWQNRVTFISTSIWGNFLLGDTTFNNVLFSRNWKKEPLDEFILNLSGLRYNKK